VKRSTTIIAVAVAMAAIAFGLWAQPKPRAYTPHDPLHGLVYFPHPTSGGLMLYVSFELEPNREYDVQVTSDGVNWSAPWRKSTRGALHDEYYSFNIDPCVAGGALWPRVVDVGPSP